jgi:predicted GH43/DUF377 family glycosyl hydrolase
VAVAERILAMEDAKATATLAEVTRRFAHRHRELVATWEKNFALVARRLGRREDVTAEKALLIGAYFTREVAIESAALLNPSMVAHPDQSGLAPGETRFVMSLRAIGEGHISCIEFRTGVIGPGDDVRVDDPGRFVQRGLVSPRSFDKQLLHAKLAEHGCDNNAAALVLDRLDARFTAAEVEVAIAELHHDLLSRAAVGNAVERIRWVAANNYEVEFPTSSPVAERVLWPHGPSELHGMEDARFVRFQDDDGAVSYRATYTAFDQAQITPQLLSTTDFCTFAVSQLSGKFATNKGMALFPRKLDGRLVALSRWDGERLAITTSADGTDWAQGTNLELVSQPWGLVQVGNCGPPLETPEGWLVLTHGVGPMREYSIGAVLLDLDDPTRVVASLPAPLLVADHEEREGYVPNVVYSCGGLVHDGTLVLPYGLSDRAVGFALVEMDRLLDRLAPAAVRSSRSATALVVDHTLLPSSPRR